MSGKRKANEMSPSEPQEKLSKKAKLKQARERAAQFAQRDKEKIQSQRAKKYGTASPKAGAQKKAPKNGGKDKAVGTIVGTPMAKKKTLGKKLTLSERKKIASENAKEFAARDRAGLKSKKMATAAASPSAMEVDDNEYLPSNAVHPSPVPETLPNHQNFGAAIDPSQVEAFEQMRRMQQSARTLPRISPMNMAISSQSNEIEEINEEDDMPPPPPALMAQVSTQVLLNAQKERLDDSNAVSTEERQTEEEMDQLIANDNIDAPKPESIDGNDQVLEEKKPRARWLPRIAAMIIAAVILVPAIVISSMILMLPVPPTESVSSPDDKVIPEEPICYFNSDSEYQEGCSNSSGVHCPKGGVCEGGKLVDCDNIFQDMSDKGDKCVLGENYIPMKDTLMNLLVSHASEICDHTSKPSFKYTMLQKDQPMILEDESDGLVEALKDEGFVIYERDGLYVGLPEGFKLSMPLYCFLGNIAQWLLQEVGLLLLGILRFTISNLSGFVSTYPLPAGVIFFILFSFLKIRNYLAAKKKRQEDIVQIRQIAYKTLAESCGVEHCATHIRDEIAMTLHPDSKKLRLTMQRNVWPKIVDDVKRDTRVRKFQTLNKDGKTREMWQWTAASKASSQS